METRAPFIIVGAFVLAAIGAVFGFVYWLHNSAGTGARTLHHVQFDGSVSGLLVGAAVLFNGIQVGEVTDLGLAIDSPRRVNVTIAVATGTPVRADTKVGLDFQGLTGVPVIALEGGKDVGPSTGVQTLIADPAAGLSMTQAARNALGRVDSVLAENAEPLKDTIANLKSLFGRFGQEYRWSRQHRCWSRTYDRRRRGAGAKGLLRSDRAKRLCGSEKADQGIDHDSRTDRRRYVADAAHAVLPQRRTTCIRRHAVERQHTENASGQTDPGFREL